VDVTAVLDTNTVLYILGGRLAEALPEAHYLVSVITEMELLSYRRLASSDEEQIRQFLSRVVGLNDAI
jgi:hypothetical protein